MLHPTRSLPDRPRRCIRAPSAVSSHIRSISSPKQDSTNMINSQFLSGFFSNALLIVWNTTRLPLQILYLMLIYYTHSFYTSNTKRILTQTCQRWFPPLQASFDSYSYLLRHRYRSKFLDVSEPETIRKTIQLKRIYLIKPKFKVQDSSGVLNRDLITCIHFKPKAVSSNVWLSSWAQLIKARLS